MSARGKLGMSIKHVAILAGLMSLGGCLGDNLGLNSVNQPVVAGNSATVPGCPNWSSQGRDSAAATDANFGCAVNSNFAAMIADPADLIHGRSYTGSDVEISTRAVRAWRDTPPTGKGGALEKTAAKGAQ